MIWGQIVTWINFSFVTYLVFCQFGTCPGGGGWGQIKIKDHLSPAEAEIRAELGKN